ncbi:polysaccharide deacetylase family protein [Cellvibrio sp. OA-2007]|uniref:polysaccharide deacetylase family protein n=1 Tax=Cellvibrio sp. OA-2007 TaxID=529823 RepID=UPI0007839EC5|nr:polysaccharide deacetylase family protein [Cellvibrio sp. OA-2007]
MFKQILLMLVVITSSLHASATSNPNPTEKLLDDIVTAQRAMILLLDKSPSNDPLSDYIFAARNAYVVKQEGIEQLITQAEAEQSSSKLTQASETLIRYTQTTLQSHPADLLAFNDLYDELMALEKARALPAQELAKLERAATDYQKAFDQYRSDYSKALDKLTTRGQQYESWLDYISFLNSQFDTAQLLRHYAQEKAQLFRYMTRGENDSKTKKDALTETTPKIMWGNDLPEKTVVLTFDDGPHARNTGLVLDILKQYEVNGYFFTVGRNLGEADGEAVTSTRNDAITKRIIAEGHILANHSYSHSILTKLADEGRKAEITKTNLLISNSQGSANTLFRPPYGSRDKALDALASKEGMISVMWNIDSMDWADPIPESIADRTLRELEKYKKGILLFHDIHKQTVNALPTLLTALANEGYRVVTLDGRSFSENSTGLPKVQAPKTEFYGTSWAVVIGINQYQSWPKLEYAVNDAQAVAARLETKLGFKKENIIALYDEEATSERITEVLGYQLADPNLVKENDRVFVFYAGHGMTRDLPNGKALGYLIPVDADTNRFQNRGISMTQINDFSALIPAKHVYFVMDSCYSGLALTRAGVSIGQSLNYINQITERKARQILTAGGADQQVADGGPGGHSIFTWTFLQALDGLADTDNNGYVTASELGTYVAPVVSSYAEQTPSFGNLLGSEGGDFVFKINSDAAAAINQKLIADSKRIEAELTSLRKDTSENVRRRLELEIALEKEQQAQTTNTSAAASSSATGDATSSTAAKTSEERKNQARRLNASAMEFFKEKKYAQAKSEWAEAVRLNPYNPTIVNNYAYVLDTMNENDEALKWYYRTVELDARRTAVYWNLGDIMVELGRKQDAIPYYERFLHLYPSFKDAKKIRAKIEEYKREIAAAEAALDTPE